MRIAKHIVLFITYGIICATIGVVSLYISFLNARPDLQPWHEAELKHEFRAERAGEVPDLAAYTRLEERLFRELDEKVYARVGVGPGFRFNRYSHGSASDPASYPRNWNRTFEMTVSQPRGGALLLHGLSDSPYSMRRLAEILHRQGFWVVGLRLPGHGTAPSGLLHVTWKDFAAATRIAARHLNRQMGPNKPFYIAGYSNGAALAVEYSLAVLEGKDLPQADGLLLVSPAIGVSPVAALAKWQARLATFGELEKMAWSTIYPEYDPYKYNSFAVNAGDQIYQLTRTIAARIQRLDPGGGVKGFPKLLVLQSVADATITPGALIDGLFRRLAPEGHELVLFDINRHAEAEALLISDPETLTQSLLSNTELPFALTLVTNTDPESSHVHALHRPLFSENVVDETLAAAWPVGVYSLSHVALPFAPTDPIYGHQKRSGHSLEAHGVHLGRVELRGESGLLVFPTDQLTRLRFNPFFDYMKRRVIEFVSTQDSSG